MDKHFVSPEFDWVDCFLLSVPWFVVVTVKSFLSLFLVQRVLLLMLPIWVEILNDLTIVSYTFFSEFC